MLKWWLLNEKRLPILKISNRLYYFNSPSSTWCYNYLTTKPFPIPSPGLTNSSTPSEFSAIKIMPCDSMPFNFRGAKLANNKTCFPMVSSGLKN